MPDSTPPSSRPAPSFAVALVFGFSTYVMWGFFPLYFQWLGPANPLEVIVHRAFWGLLFCLLFLLLTGHLSQLRTLWQDRAALLRLVVAGFLIVANWTTYVYAILSGNSVDAALGYFINPLVTVALAVIVLKERINLAQGIAVTLGVIAVIVLIVGVGRVPWVSLSLAFTFGFYSLVKKSVAGRVAALPGMVVETAATVPFLLIYYAYLLATGTSSFQLIARGAAHAPANSAWLHLALLIGSGLLTIIPLVLFALAAQGLPLGILGLLQYISPVLQLLIGVFIFHEHMVPARWVGAAIVWVALIFLSADSIFKATKAARLRHRASRP